MKETTRAILTELTERFPRLAGERQNIESAFEVIQNAYESGGKLLLCGNGGSAADCEHIVGELMKSFQKARPITEEERAVLRQAEDGERLADVLERGLKAIALTSHPAFTTAFANDKEPSAVFAQQLYVLGDKGDVLLAVSTSGNAKSCVYAATVARLKGMKVVALTGETPSALSKASDVCVRVPETQTYKVQELHIPIYHCLCAMLENEFFG